MGINVAGRIKHADELKDLKMKLSLFSRCNHNDLLKWKKEARKGDQSDSMRGGLSLLLIILKMEERGPKSRNAGGS